jgi:hypothetical protein
MSIISSVISGLAACNMHLSVYGAFGAILIVRAYSAVRDGRGQAAREDAVMGLVHIMLSMF